MKRSSPSLRPVGGSRRTAFGAFLAATLLAPAASAQSQPTPEHFAFISNAGQWRPEVRFRAIRGAGAAWFTTRGFTLDLGARHKATAADLARQARERREQGASGGDAGLGARGGVVLAFDFVGAGQPTSRGEKQLPTKYHFLRGNAPEQWRRSVPAFERVRYESMYPGVDVVARAGRGLFAYDLHVAAGANLDQVVLQCRGHEGLDIDEDGRLIIDTPLGQLKQSAPVAWQPLANGERLPVRCEFVRFDGGRFGFRVQERDPELPLVIDPDVSWWTYFGGDRNTQIYAMANGVLTQSVITATGSTNSSTLPTTQGAYQRTRKSGPDVFVSRFDPSKTGAAQLVWSTFLGGGARDVALDIAEDTIGSLHIGGLTRSFDFPVTNGALQTSHGGSEVDGFVARLDATGSRLMYCTYLGGNNNDWVGAIAVDAAMQTTVLGQTFSAWTGGNTGIPRTANAYQRDHGGQLDLFVTRINTLATGSAQLVYSTYLGGVGWEGFGYNSTAWELDIRQMSMAQNAQGQVLIGARTGSANYPLQNAYQTTVAGQSDVVVTLLDPSLSGNAQIVYSTLIGQTDWEAGTAVAFAPNGQFCVAGFTYSKNYPATSNAFDTTHNGGTTQNDVFVSWLDPSKSGAQQLVYSTYLGGNLWDSCCSLYVDENGVANLTGFGSAGFPTTADGFATTQVDAPTAWMARIYPGLAGAESLVYGSYISGQSGTSQSFGYAIEAGPNSSSFVAGETSSRTMGTTNGSFMGLAPAGQWSSFVLRVYGRNRGVRRIGAATPAACAGDLVFSARGTPSRGNSSFALTVDNAEANAQGFLGIGVAPATINLCAAVLVTNPLLLVPFQANGQGAMEIPAAIPNSIALNTSVLAQAVLANSGCCLTAANGLGITVFR